ncbi:hypothetical protein IT774_02750 [Salinimonas marina]|uniref:Transposase n=1 Tax=Salinimonas marina TaxID=2785918 RepID=A0A7S9HDD3_9ALTE|nr:hypothetical protein IT774_02750 [Salinimonas marina]
MLGNHLTLRSRLPELEKQELWGVMLTYNLVRYQMVQVCFNFKGNYLPYQLSFNGVLAVVVEDIRRYERKLLARTFLPRFDISVS